MFQERSSCRACDCVDVYPQPASIAGLSVRLPAGQRVAMAQVHIESPRMPIRVNVNLTTSRQYYMEGVQRLPIQHPATANRGAVLPVLCHVGPHNAGLDCALSVPIMVAPGSAIRAIRIDVTGSLASHSTVWPPPGNCAAVTVTVRQTPVAAADPRTQPNYLLHQPQQYQPHPDQQDGLLMFGAGGFHDFGHPGPDEPWNREVAQPQQYQRHPQRMFGAGGFHDFGHPGPDEPWNRQAAQPQQYQRHPQQQNRQLMFGAGGFHDFGHPGLDEPLDREVAQYFHE